MRVHTTVAGVVSVLGAVVLCAAAIPARGTPPGTVTGFKISADPRSFSGSCPAKIAWTATIHVANPPVQVDYRWERSDGVKAAPKRVTVTEKTASVTDTWQLGGAGAHLNVWERVHVISPNDKSSGTAPVKITCS